MLVDVLGYIISFLYNLCKSYGIAIVLFTLFSKIILLPISIWVQKNSIKMVKMQPSINKIKINYFGDKDKIAEEITTLYKKEKYNALVTIIPLIIQIVLLLGLVEVINKPLSYILDVPSNTINEYKNIYLEENKDVDKESSSIELMVVNDIKGGNIKKYEIINNYKKYNNEINEFNLRYLGIDLSLVAKNKGGICLLIPLITGLSALAMCIAQNKMNVLQSEQSNINKYGMLSFSVLLSLYLGFFVPAAIALYWTFSNLFSILNQWLLNLWINPKKYINFDELEKGQKELKKLMYLDKKKKRTKEQIKKEKEDYKKFFKIANKHLVFYSESNGFYKYYKNIIEYILDKTNIVIHYITSDYNDNIFNMAQKNKQIKAYYIEEKKLITLMMKMDTDVVVMTMPDIENYHIKKSYVRSNITYIYVPHCIDSINLTQRYKSINGYDVFLACGKYQREEAEATFKLFNLNRKIVDCGYPLLDDMLTNHKEKTKTTNIKTILIAPSWQKDNICDLCLDELIDELLKNKNYNIIIRPHPQEIKHKNEKFKQLKEKYKNQKQIAVQTDFSSNNSVLDADLLITDWSGIAYEYAFTTKKPVLFINTPMKIMNAHYKDIKIKPYTIWTREIIGKSIDANKIKDVNKIVKDLINNKNWNKTITSLLNDSIYNIGHSGEEGAKYIIECIQERIQERSKNEDSK